MPTHTIATGWAPEEVWGVDMISSNLRSLVWLRIVKVLQREGGARGGMSGTKILSPQNSEA